jgi:hypothetical protein
MRARIAFARKRGTDAPQLLLDVAQRFVTLDGGQARDTYLEAIGAAVFAGRLAALGVRETAGAARAAPAPSEPPRPTDALLDGVVARFTDGYVASVEPLRRALVAFRAEADRSDEGLPRWLWTACPVAPEPLAAELWDDDAWHELATSAVRLARDAGALTTLPVALSYRAGLHIHAGEFTAASSLLAEADAITTATGNAPLRYISLLLAAWRGDEAVATRLIESCTRDAIARGEGRAIGLIEYVGALLHNGLARYPVAFACARRACEHDDIAFYGWSLIELIEAAARSGALDAAETALRELEQRTRAAATDWALGMPARSSALLSDGDAAGSAGRRARGRGPHPARERRGALPPGLGAGPGRPSRTAGR